MSVVSAKIALDKYSSFPYTATKTSSTVHLCSHGLQMHNQTSDITLSPIIQLLQVSFDLSIPGHTTYHWQSDDKVIVGHRYRPPLPTC